MPVPHPLCCAVVCRAPCCTAWRRWSGPWTPCCGHRWVGWVGGCWRGRLLAWAAAGVGGCWRGQCPHARCVRGWQFALHRCSTRSRSVPPCPPAHPVFHCRTPPWTSSASGPAAAQRPLGAAAAAAAASCDFLLGAAAAQRSGAFFWHTPFGIRLLAYAFWHTPFGIRLWQRSLWTPHLTCPARTPPFHRMRLQGSRLPGASVEWGKVPNDCILHIEATSSSSSGSGTR